MENSRVRFLEQMLYILGYQESLKALDFVMREMCSEKGFKRHNGTHYYYHLVDTTQDLINHGVRDQNIITACLLHDAIEDIEGVTYFTIKDKFNEEVANMVGLVSKVKGVDYKVGNHLELYLNEILHNVGASLIKTADRKHNFGTLRDATPEKKLRQAIETETRFIPFFKEARNMYPRYSAYFFSAKTTIEPHLFEIKEHYEEIARMKEEFDKTLKSLKES
jgi:GTP pyrophosphokinase